MKLIGRSIAAITLMAALQVARAGDVTGKITLKGNPPPEATQNVTDKNCGRNIITSRHFIVGKGGELADVFIRVIEGLGDKQFPVPDKPKLLDQVGCEYTPYIVGLQTGQQLLVRNSDPTLHNVHPIPVVAGNKEDNKAQMPKGKDLSFTFPKEEVFVRFKCDVHPWMFAWVGVVNHPFYAVSDKDGKFKIEGLPPGKYKLEAVHRKAGKQTKEVTVDATGAKEVNFDFEVK